jgi:hypothetical protein
MGLSQSFYDNKSILFNLLNEILHGDGVDQLTAELSRCSRRQRISFPHSRVLTWTHKSCCIYCFLIFIGKIVEVRTKSIGKS